MDLNGKALLYPWYTSTLNHFTKCLNSCGFSLKAILATAKNSLIHSSIRANAAFFIFVASFVSADTFDLFTVKALYSSS
ncbi:hypothetical protein DDZ16_02765 [Marinilabilia rubra]|uniref:Uncharacterized protein n=1 Tax=Marinilabilia rubra TaxID=2162893 RepID=A0A2U2BEC3_9BACT|nr:hypothetical protein DDZ16_02765 [Marinilabilia rubra]